jgi:hypothetical protein
VIRVAQRDAGRLLSGNRVLGIAPHSQRRAGEFHPAVPSPHVQAYAPIAASRRAPFHPRCVWRRQEVISVLESCRRPGPIHWAGRHGCGCSTMSRRPSCCRRPRAGRSRPGQARPRGKHNHAVRQTRRVLMNPSHGVTHPILRNSKDASVTKQRTLQQVRSHWANSRYNTEFAS